MRLGLYSSAWVCLLGVCLPALGCNAAEDSSATQADENAPNATPVSLKEAIAAIDLRTFPMMDGATRRENSPAGAHFSVPNGTVADATAFARGKLEALGWKTSADAKLTTINDFGAQMLFTKNSQRLYAAIGVSPADKNLNFALFHLGNTDARKLPHVAGAEFTDSIPSRTICTTSAKPDDVQKALRPLFAPLGWREYRDPPIRGMESFVREDRSLKFLQNGTAIDVTIMPVSGKTNIYTTVRLLKEQWPIDPSAVTIEFQEDPLFLFYPTKLSLDEAVEFNRRELTALGLKERKITGEPSKTAFKATFDAPDGKPIKLEVVRNQDLTFVMLRPWTDEDDKAAGDKK